MAGSPAIKGHCFDCAQFPEDRLSAFGCDDAAHPARPRATSPQSKPRLISAVNWSRRVRFAADALDERNCCND